MHRPTQDEWLTRMVVVDGFSMHGIAHSKFVQYASLNLHFDAIKSPTTVGKRVENYVESLKVKVSLILSSYSYDSSIVAMLLLHMYCGIK